MARGRLTSCTMVWLCLATFMPINRAVCLAFTGHLIRQFWEISPGVSSGCPFPTDGKGAAVRHKIPVWGWCLVLLLPCCFGARSTPGSAGWGSADTRWRGSLRSVPHHCIHNMQLLSFSTNCPLQQSSTLSENGVHTSAVMFLEPACLHTS